MVRLVLRRRRTDPLPQLPHARGGRRGVQAHAGMREHVGGTADELFAFVARLIADDLEGLAARCGLGQYEVVAVTCHCLALSSANARSIGGSSVPGRGDIAPRPAPGLSVRS